MKVLKFLSAILISTVALSAYADRNLNCTQTDYNEYGGWTASVNIVTSAADGSHSTAVTYQRNSGPSGGAQTNPSTISGISPAAADGSINIANGNRQAYITGDQILWLYGVSQNPVALNCN